MILLLYNIEVTPIGQLYTIYPLLTTLSYSQTCENHLELALTYNVWGSQRTTLLNIVFGYFGMR